MVIGDSASKSLSGVSTIVTDVNDLANQFRRGVSTIAPVISGSQESQRRET